MTTRAHQNSNVCAFAYSVATVYFKGQNTDFFTLSFLN